MATPHDSFGKHLFSRPAEAAGLLTSVLPAPLLAQLDLSTLAVLPGSFVDEQLQWRFADLLYEVELAGSAARIYVLAELQSTVDPLLSLRVLIYLARIWDQWLREREAEPGPRPQRVPAILPVVLYQGPGGRSAATEFLELVDLPPAALEATRAHLPSFRFLLDDLSCQSDEGLRGRGLSPLATLGLLLLKHARDGQEELLRLLVEAADLLNRLESREDLVLTVSYILRVGNVGADRLLEALGARAEPAVKEIVMTAAEELLQRGEARGLLQGERRLLLRLLRQRFPGQLTAALEERVSQGSEAELERWSDRLLSAASLAEVLG